VKIFESHFWYTQGQRNGILFLFILLFSIELILTFCDFQEEEFPFDGEFALLEHKLDSLKRSETVKEKYKPKPFNPNYISDFKAYQLGLSTIEIDKLLAFRAAGKFINSAAEFQKVTKIHDSLLAKIAPFFKFPEWAVKKTITKTSRSIPKILSKTNDLNYVGFDQLLLFTGVTSEIAQRILAYKKLLGGYSVNEQLYEVYGLDKQTAHLILAKYKVVEKPKLEKLNINTASFKEILHTPYIEYELTKKICNFRDRNGHIDNLETLKKIDSFPVKKFDRIALYLYAE